MLQLYLSIKWCQELKLCGIFLSLYSLAHSHSLLLLSVLAPQMTTPPPSTLQLLYLQFHYFTTRETETLVVGPQVHKYHGWPLSHCPPLHCTRVPGPVTVRRPSVHPLVCIMAVREGVLPRERTKEVSFSPRHHKMSSVLTKETKILEHKWHLSNKFKKKLWSIYTMKN